MNIPEGWKLVPVEKKQKSAYRKVKTALSQGILVRPDRCPRCNEVDKKGSDGRSTIHAHHHDYDKPLEVEWLCAKCHRAETPLPEVMGAPSIGMKNSQSKLTDDAVKMIRASTESSRKLAARFGVDHKTILRAKNKELWRHI